jgi:3D (Asp-Asp-Asp) domain-containing protein
VSITIDSTSFLKINASSQGLIATVAVRVTKDRLADTMRKPRQGEKTKLKHTVHCKGTKRKYKHIAAAIAGAAIISSAMVHGLPAPQAPAKPDIKTENAQESTRDDERAIDITATAYAPGSHDNDQWGDKTYLGTRIRPGVIAVDPRIIPLGSRVLIKYPDGRSEYAVAEDTGGAIKGHRIDVAKSTVGEARGFGIKPVKVYVLNRSESV